MYIYIVESVENAKKYETKFVNIARWVLYIQFLFFRTYILSNRGKLVYIKH